jgi:hypothetical protein
MGVSVRVKSASSTIWEWGGEGAYFCHGNLDTVATRQFEGRDQIRVVARDHDPFHLAVQRQCCDINQNRNLGHGKK